MVSCRSARKASFNLVPTPSVSRNQDRVAVLSGIEGEKTAEAADIGENLRPGGGLDQRFDQLDKGVAGIDIDPGVFVGNGFVAQVVPPE